jgi:phage FluMu gp28-like protein
MTQASPATITATKTTAGRVLLPWQEAWRRDQSDLKIWEKSRRIGATYTEANDAVMTRLTGRKLDYWFSSADESAAYEFADYCRFWMDTAGGVKREVLREEIEDDTRRTGNAYVVMMPSGQRIVAMTSNPRRFRSKGGDIGLDEFAYHDQPQEMYRAAEPCTMWGGRLRILSTHNGELSEFNRLVQMGKRVAGGEGRPDDIPFAVHRITLLEAVEQGLVERINATQGTTFSREEFIKRRRQSCRSEDHWLQEYMAIPSIDTSAWLTFALLEACESDQAGRWDLVGTGPLYIGMDIGETQDRTVIWTLELVGDTYWTREVVTYTTEPLRVKMDALMLRLQNPRVVRACIDGTGVGAQIGQEAARTGKAESIKFSLPIKDALASPLRKHFEDRTIRTPADSRIRQALHAVRMIATAGGTPRFDAQRSADGHADEFWALALARYAATTARCDARAWVA